jgi:hypothetical protein
MTGRAPVIVIDDRGFPQITDFALSVNEISLHSRILWSRNAIYTHPPPVLTNRWHAYGAKLLRIVGTLEGIRTDLTHKLVRGSYKAEFNGGRGFISVFHGLLALLSSGIEGNPKTPEPVVEVNSGDCSVPFTVSP